MAGRLAGKIAVITGASRGIGRAVALRFADEGAHSILVARSIPELEALDDAIRARGGHATLAPLDLSETERLGLLSSIVSERFGRLDILVGNAATLGELTPVHHVPDDMWERVMRVNLTANWALLRAFDSLLRLSNAGRAMFVTSGVTHGNSAFWGPYAVSKAGLEMMVRTYAAENEKTSIRANLIDPGVVRTRMRAQAFPNEDPEHLPMPESIADLFVELALPAMKETGKIFRVKR